VPILSAAGAALTLLVALGYEYFYGQLEVRPAELGLGAREILSHGALGLLLLLGYNGFILGAFTFLAWAAGALMSDVGHHWKTRRHARAAPATAPETEEAQPSTDIGGKEPAKDVPAWRAILVSALVLMAGASVVVLSLRTSWFSTLFGALAVSALLWGPLLWRWMRHGGIDAESLRQLAPFARGIPLLAASLWILGGGVFALVAALSQRDPNLFGTLGGLILLAFGAIIGSGGVRELGRLWSSSDAAPRTTGWFILGALTLMVAVQLAFVAFDAAFVVRRLVERREYTPTNLSPLVSAPVTCVRPQWLGSGAAPSWLPRSAFHLGGAGGTVVLYQPDVGAIRLPASVVALVPSPDRNCR
jgi:hypothetical protein